MNWVQHQDTTAVWLMVDAKPANITGIIFFSFVLGYVLFFVCMRPRMDIDGAVWYQMIACTPCLAAGVIGVPLIIMGVIIEVGLNGPLGEALSVADIYQNVDGGCTIVAVLGHISYTAADTK
eukprot:417973_1